MGVGIPEALEELRRGNFIILYDDKERENEGDLLLAAEKATPEKLNFMLKEGRGIMCMPVDGMRLDELAIPLMVSENTDKFRTPFTITIDAREGITTGVSVHDRMKTLAVVLDPHSKPEDLVRPGHMFPLRAAQNGTLDRKGHTDAAVDLMKLAGMKPVAVIAEIMNDNGAMAQFTDLEKFSQRHHIKIANVADIIEYRKTHPI